MYFCINEETKLENKTIQFNQIEYKKARPKNKTRKIDGNLDKIE